MGSSRGGVRDRAGRRRAIGCLVGILLGVSGLLLQAQPVQITVFVAPADGGFVQGDGSYAAGETVLLLAVAYAGFSFSRWIDDGQTVSTDTTIEFLADQHRVLTAEFVRQAPWIGFSGRWRGGISLLPGFTVAAQQFELGFDLPPGSNAWRTRVSTTFSGDGEWTGLQFTGSGRLGEIGTSSGITFTPLTAAYQSAFIALQWSGQGVTLGFRANHIALGGSPPGPYLLYTWTLRSRDLSVTARLEEVCGTGVSFRDLQAQISGIEICCGVTLRGVFSLADCGFDYIGLFAHRIEVMDGLSVDIALRYTLNGKEVRMTPRWDPICLPCITLYGDLDQGGTDLYGIKIRCCLLTDLADPDCPECPPTRCPPGSRVGAPYLEYVVATDPAKVPVGFRGDEFSYLKIGQCGEGCCGGAFDLELAAFFSPTGGLFGLTRIVGTVVIPWSQALRWTIDAEFNFVGGDTTLKLGWDYRF